MTKMKTRLYENAYIKNYTKKSGKAQQTNYYACISILTEANRKWETNIKFPLRKNFRSS
jgi:hypothetical protein